MFSGLLFLDLKFTRPAVTYLFNSFQTFNKQNLFVIETIRVNTETFDKLFQVFFFEVSPGNFYFSR